MRVVVLSPQLELSVLCACCLVAAGAAGIAACMRACRRHAAAVMLLWMDWLQQKRHCWLALTPGTAHSISRCSRQGRWERMLGLNPRRLQTHPWLHCRLESGRMLMMGVFICCSPTCACTCRYLPGGRLEMVVMMRTSTLQRCLRGLSWHARQQLQATPAVQPSMQQRSTPARC